VIEPLFLSLAEVIEIHGDQVRRYGGKGGVRDMGLLESALAQPGASFGGTWLHRDLHAMAAAYAYHLCRNHPFVDGNKRTALACALVFLRLNGIVVSDPKGRLKQVMLDIVAGRMDKARVSTVLEQVSRRSTRT
jgi:death-on-curing protein